MKDTIINILDTYYKMGQISSEAAEKLIAALWDDGEEADLPWDDDNKLRVVAYRGRRLVKKSEAGDKLFELRLDDAPQGDIECWGSATIRGSVNGNVTAGVSVSVEGAVAMQVNAGTSVTVEGDNYAPISAGTDVTVNGDNYGPLNGGMNVTINGGDNCPPNGEPLRENNGFDFGSIGDFVNRTVRSAMQTAEGAVHWGMGKARKAAVRVEKSWKNDGFHMETPPVDGIEVVVRKNGEEIAVSDETGLHLDITGDVPSLYSALSVNVNGDVCGDIEAGANVSCGDIAQNVSAGGSVNCGDIAGNVSAGGSVDCGDVGSNAAAGENVDCGDVGRNVSAGGSVDCGDVGGSVEAGGDVSCGDVGGDVSSSGSVACGDISGGIRKK